MGAKSRSYALPRPLLCGFIFVKRYQRNYQKIWKADVKHRVINTGHIEKLKSNLLMLQTLSNPGPYNFHIKPTLMHNNANAKIHHPNPNTMNAPSTPKLQTPVAFQSLAFFRWHSDLIPVIISCTFFCCREQFTWELADLESLPTSLNIDAEPAAKRLRKDDFPHFRFGEASIIYWSYGSIVLKVL